MTNNKVFISHASGDYRDPEGNIIPGNAISEILKVLDDNHITRWIDESGLVSAKGWCQQIEDAIDECNVFLFVSSEKANSSINTANEIAHALERKKHIIPVKLDKSRYHKDIRLNLIRIHYLKYYEDRDKALKDLISTIKNINTDTVIVNTAVKSADIPDEQKVNGELLSQRVLSIFNSKDIKTSVKEFKALTQKLQCESEDGFDTLSKYIQRLQSLSEERNYNVRYSRIERLISDIKEDRAEVERSNSIMVILLKMFLYFCLDDIPEVLTIQKELNDVKYELSYIERNADTINDVSSAVVRGATFVASAAALLMGKGGTAARAGLSVSSKGGKLKVVKTSQEIENEKKAFDTLKKAAQGLIFIEN